MGHVPTAVQNHGGQKYWMPHEKAIYPITTFNELAIHIIHSNPTGKMYKEVTEALEIAMVTINCKQHSTYK
jgi:hypothetical protein